MFFFCKMIRIVRKSLLNKIKRIWSWIFNHVFALSFITFLIFVRKPNSLFLLFWKSFLFFQSKHFPKAFCIKGKDRLKKVSRWKRAHLAMRHSTTREVSNLPKTVNTMSWRENPPKLVFKLKYVNVNYYLILGWHEVVFQLI